MRVIAGAEDHRRRGDVGPLQQRDLALVAAVPAGRGTRRSCRRRRPGPPRLTMNTCSTLSKSRQVRDDVQQTRADDRPDGRPHVDVGRPAAGRCRRSSRAASPGTSPPPATSPASRRTSRSAPGSRAAPAPTASGSSGRSSSRPGRPRTRAGTAASSCNGSDRFLRRRTKSRASSVTAPAISTMKSSFAGMLTRMGRMVEDPL